MKRLLLMRHAKAVPHNPGADHQRPLVERGRNDATVVGERLGELGATPDLVLCSTAERTRETLDCAAAALNGSTEVRYEDRIYGASPGELLSLVQEVDDSVETLMLVGHNPGTHMIAVTLAGSGDQIDTINTKFPTAAVADLRLEGGWSEAAPGAFELADFIVARDLR